MMCFSGLVALLLLIAAFFLGSVFWGSTGASDKPMGILLGLLTLAYIAGPTFLVRRFYLAKRFAAAALTLAIWNVVGVTTTMILMGAIDAGARP
jgi:hypothetical protein